MNIIIWSLEHYKSKSVKQWSSYLTTRFTLVININDQLIAYPLFLIPQNTQPVYSSKPSPFAPPPATAPIIPAVKITKIFQKPPQPRTCNAPANAKVCSNKALCVVLINRINYTCKYETMSKNLELLVKQLRYYKIYLDFKHLSMELTNNLLNNLRCLK